MKKTKKKERLRYPDKFRTKRELLWYVKGLKDAKTQAQRCIEIEEKRYLDTMVYHIDFDEKGNVLNSSVQPRSRKR